MYAHLKSSVASFSFRYFARQAGFASPNFLQLVIEGKRNLTGDSIPKFAKALKLNKQESDFFNNLVLFNQASEPDAKNRFYERMTHNRRYREIRRLETEQYNFYSHWYYSAVREMVTCNEFIEHPAWIAARCVPKITEKQAAQALKLLLDLKLLKRNERGRLVQSDATISSGAEVRSLAVSNFHREMLKKAAQSIVIVPADERDISSVTLGVAAADLPVLKEKINAFRKELLAGIGASTKPTNRVYQLNIQLFPLTRKSEGEKKS